MQGSSLSSPHDPRRFGAASVAGHRPTNQDAWMAGPMGGPIEFYVVADGVGGQEQGALAAQTAVDVALRAFQGHCAAGGDAPTALSIAVATANSEVYAVARRMGVERMGCTLVAIALTAGRLDVAHVGDARAYLLQGSRLYPLTKDHTWIQEQVDRGTITPQDAARHEFRHIVQRVLGNEATVEATMGSFGMGPGDRIILMTDGVHDMIEDARLAQLAAGGTPQAAAEALVATALAAGSEDNVTAVVVATPGGKTADAARTPTASKRATTERIIISPGAAGGPGLASSPAPAAAVALPPRGRSTGGSVLLLAVALLGGLIFLAAMLSRGDDAPAPVLAVTIKNPDVVGPAAAVDTAVPQPTSTVAAGYLPAESYPGPAEAPAESYPDPATVPPEAGNAPPVRLRGGEVYLWAESQAEDGDICGETTDYQIKGDRAYRLDDETAHIKTTNLDDGSCGPLPFVHVRAQVMDGSWIDGWILESKLDDKQ